MNAPLMGGNGLMAMWRWAAVIVGALGVAELVLMAVGVVPVPTSLDTLGEAMGAVHALGGLVVILVLMRLAAPAAGRGYAVVSLAAAAVLAIATVAWLTWLGQPLSVDPDQKLRVLAIVAGDLAFGFWLIAARLLPRGPRPPALAGMAVALAGLAVIEALAMPSFVPLESQPGIIIEPGDSLGGAIVMAAAALLGFLLLAVWQLVLSRWLAALGAAPASSPQMPVSPAR